MFDCLYKYRLSSVEPQRKVIKVVNVIVITIVIISIVEAVVGALVGVVIVVAIVVVIVIVIIVFFTTVVALKMHSSLWFKAIYGSIICSWEI